MADTHRITCSICGHDYDPGDLTQVLYHQVHEPVPVLLNDNGEPAHGIRIRGPRVDPDDQVTKLIELTTAKERLTRRVKVLEDMLAGARMTIAGLRAAAQGPKLIAEAEAAYKDGLSEGPDDDVLDHTAEEPHE